MFKFQKDYSNRKDNKRRFSKKDLAYNINYMEDNIKDESSNIEKMFEDLDRKQAELMEQNIRIIRMLDH